MSFPTYDNLFGINSFLVIEIEVEIRPSNGQFMYTIYIKK